MRQRAITPAFVRILRRLIVERVDLDPAKCWPWPGALYGNGYGNIKAGPNEPGTNRLVHVVMYENFVGSRPPARDLHHTCHTEACDGGRLCEHRRCCNPWHLRPETRSINLKRGVGVGGDRTSAAFRARR